jgi:hypothetical protein
MTMQVGMVGTDGILLASDTRWMNTYLGLRQTGGSSKIRISHQRGIAISCARNMETGFAVADEIIAKLRDKDWKYPELAMEGMASRILGQSGERQDIQLLIVLLTPIPRLFFLRVGKVGVETKPLCMRESKKAVAGDNVNAAVFFTERYYAEKPIRELVPIAAQLIVAAAELNPGAIGGLEILLCDTSGFHQLSDVSIRELETQASTLSKTVAASLARLRQFTYAPTEIV